MNTLKQQLETSLSDIKDKKNTVLVIGKNRTSTYNWALKFFSNSDIHKTNQATRESRKLDIVIDKGTGNNKKTFDEIWIKIRKDGYYIIKNWSKSNNQKTMDLVGHITSKKKLYGIKSMIVIDGKYSIAIFQKL